MGVGAVLAGGVAVGWWLLASTGVVARFIVPVAGVYANSLDGRDESRDHETGVTTIGRRINVVGTTGSGKSTLAAGLSAWLGIPYVELDALYWRPGWQHPEREALRARVREALSGDAWVVDGNYSSLRDLVWPRAETVVWLDLPLRVSLLRVIRRTVERSLTRELLWGTNRERFRHLFERDSLLVWAVTTHRRRMLAYEAAMKNPANGHIQFVRLRSRREVARWMSTVTSSDGV